jgi:hypothetical protein
VATKKQNATLTKQGKRIRKAMAAAQKLRRRIDDIDRKLTRVLEKHEKATANASAREGAGTPRRRPTRKRARANT